MNKIFSRDSQPSPIHGGDSETLSRMNFVFSLERNLSRSNKRGIEKTILEKENRRQQNEEKSERKAASNAK